MANTKRPSWGDNAARDRDVFGQIIGQSEPDDDPAPAAAPQAPAPAPVASQSAPAVAPRQQTAVEVRPAAAPVKRGRGRPRKAVVTPQAQTMQVPVPTGAHIEPTHSLNVRLPMSQWIPFKSYTGSQIREMTTLVHMFIEVFNADPGTWVELYDLSVAHRVPVSRILGSAAATALESYVGGDQDEDEDPV